MGKKNREGCATGDKGECGPIWKCHLHALSLEEGLLHGFVAFAEPKEQNAFCSEDESPRLRLEGFFAFVIPTAKRVLVARDSPKGPFFKVKKGRRATFVVVEVVFLYLILMVRLASLNGLFEEWLVANADVFPNGNRAT